MSNQKLANDNLVAAIESRRSRRSLLKGAVVSAAGATGVAAVASAIIPAGSAFAATTQSSCVTPIPQILTIGRTAERLAVTFYSHGLKYADKLGLSWDAQVLLKAAMIEEQIHENFFASAGGQVLTSTFSFPNGEETFRDLSKFIATQQQLEGVFDSAFLAAIKEFGEQGRPDLSQIAGQIATIEAEHRALGRLIGGLSPADNWAFSPVLLGSVGDAPAVVKQAGYLSPTQGNSFTYHPVSTSDSGVIYRSPFAVQSC
jgi:hypothetical protein